jgi:pyruvate formate lyase activating enzyme
MARESKYAEQMEGGVTRCTICPRRCVLKEGMTGFCGTRENRNGKIVSLTYGQLTALAVDPIEKKPLNHFYPGSLAFSISCVSCSFKCPWCQNWELSQSKPGDVPTQYVEPKDVVSMAKRNSCTSIAYTYNEPIISLDYFEETSKVARSEGVKNVLVTNGYITLDALGEVVSLIDAANVDWKSFSEKVYREETQGDLKSVLDATVEMHRKGVHVEIAFLVIPDLNDGEEEMRAMAKYLADNMGPDVPLHLSRFYPAYKYRFKPITPYETLVRNRKIALEEGVHYVYVGNVPGTDYESTYCPSCGRKVVGREGYSITDWNLNDQMECKFCGYHIEIKGKHEDHPEYSI